MSGAFVYAKHGIPRQAARLIMAQLLYPGVDAYACQILKPR